MSRREYPHYFKDVSRFEVIDVYRVLSLWGVSDPCLQHAIKKLLCAGQRGAKDAAKDVSEAVASCRRWEEMRAEDERAPSTWVELPPQPQPSERVDDAADGEDDEGSP